MRAVAVIFVLASGAAAGAWFWSSEGAKSAVDPKPAARGGAPVAVRTADVVTGDFVEHLRTIGWVEPVAQVAIKSRVDSQILSQEFTEGQMVRKGDTLFVLDDRELGQQLARDQATQVKDQAVAKRTEADLARVRELLAKGASTQQAVDQSQADAASAAANVMADEAAIRLDQTRLGYTRILSPIDGRAGVATVSPGNLVKAADTGNLVTITQIAPIRVTFPLPSRVLAAVKDRLGSDRPPRIRVFHPGGTDPVAAGVLTFIDNAIDTASGTVTAKAVLPNADGKLWPGMAIDVEVETDTLPGATSIPAVAIQPGQTSPYAFVMQPDLSVTLRPVTVLASEGDRAAVTGIKAGESVVVEGQARLVNGTRVRLAAEDGKTTDAPAGARVGKPRPTPANQG